jgi:multiple sugar transport system substrate-binding protein
MYDTMIKVLFMQKDLQQEIPVHSSAGGLKPNLPGLSVLYSFLDKQRIKRYRRIIFFAVVLLLLVTSGLLGILLWSKRSIPPKQIELTYWSPWLPEETIKPLLLEYEAKTGVKVNYVKQAKQDYRERLVNFLAKGEGPDIFSFHNSWVSTLKNNLAGSPQETETEFRSIFYPVAISDLLSEAGFLGVPLMFDGLGLFVNEEIFQSEVIGFPTTWDEFRKAALKLTKWEERDGKRIIRSGASLGRTDNVDFWQDILGLLLLQGRVDLSNPQVDKLAQVLKFYTLFETDDHVWDGTLPASIQAFAQGKLAMLFAPYSKVSEIKSINPNLSFKVFPVPQLPKINPTDRDITWASYWVEGVSRKSLHTKEAWEFLKFLSSYETLIRMSGFPYSRVDLAEVQKNDPYLQAFILQAPNARSGLLAAQTFDGEGGPNSSIAKIFSEAIEMILRTRDSEKAAKFVIDQLSLSRNK